MWKYEENNSSVFLCGIQGFLCLPAWQITSSFMQVWTETSTPRSLGKVCWNLAHACSVQGKTDKHTFIELFLKFDYILVPSRLKYSKLNVFELWTKQNI